jgi:hypothetical protein
VLASTGKRWDTTTPLAWSNKNKNKSKNKNKINNSGGNVTAFAPADSYACAATAAAICRVSSGGGSMGVVVAAAGLLRV